MRWHHAMSSIVAAGVVVALGPAAFGQPAYVKGVPDWDQPHLVAGAAPGGPNGAWGAWCVPAAMSDLIGFYNDAGVSGIGDNKAYPATPLWSSGSFQDDSASSVTPRKDLGWHLDTNGLGAGGAAGHRGTRLIDIEPGLIGTGGYFPSRGLSGIGVTSYGSITMPASLYPLFDNTGDPQGVHTVSAGLGLLVSEINAGRPLLGHFSHFLLANRKVVTDAMGFFPGPSFDVAEWGAPPPMFPFTDPESGEVWNPEDGLGHTVAIVGYWFANDSTSPFFGVSDAIIVHDNTDGDLSGAQKPLVLPWSSAAPWQGFSAITNVPTPGSVALFALGLAALGFRRGR